MRHVLRRVPLFAHACEVRSEAVPTRWWVRLAAASILACTLAFAAEAVVLACTAFCAARAGQVLVGNNEDYNNPRTKIWFVPSKPGSYGRVYVGFDDLTPQGGMNERGLWFDGFAAPALRATSSADLPGFPGSIIDTAMARCSTVEEVVDLFNQYNRAFLTEAILMFADASGDAVAIEPDAMVRKRGNYFVQTNFHQSLRNARVQDGRFKTASEMLERAGDDISVDLFRRILSATHQRGLAPTLYSNVYDLRSRTMHLYYFHDFERAVTFRLDDELKKGQRVLDIPALFSPNAEAEAFAARRKESPPRIPGGAIVTGVIGLLALLVTFAGYAVVRGRRRVRVGIAVLLAATAMVVVLAAVTLQRHAPASPEWIQFSMGPASGESSYIGLNKLKSNGITLKTALATAYGIPPVRVIGPDWLSHTRYSMNAVASVDAPDAFRSLLQQELKNRLRIETHLDVRPFDVLVLTADSPRLERAHAGPSIWIGTNQAHLQGASMSDLASALQSILGKPVIDGTGISGTYNLEFGWEEDRVASVTAILAERFGLRLSADKREMEVLIVDRIQRDPALTLLAGVGRITRWAPPRVRQHIADALAIH